MLSSVHIGANLVLFMSVNVHVTIPIHSLGQKCNSINVYVTDNVANELDIHKAFNKRLWLSNDHVPN